MKSYGNNYEDDEKLKNTEAGAVAAIVDQHSHANLHAFEKIGVPVIVLPKTGEVKSMEALLENPRRARARVEVRDHQSFIAYVERFRGPGTVIFAHIAEDGGSFTAILDFHVPAKTEGEVAGGVGVPDVSACAGTNGVPQWGEHVCVYKCEFTPEWKRWRERSGRLIDQAEMALFIEENKFDIATPAPAEMLELVKTLEATQGVEFKSALRLDNGDRQLGYSVRTGAKAGEKGDLVIPQTFMLKFAIFTNGPAYDIECRFRYNINGGNLVMGYEIVKPHKLIELALDEARNALVETLTPIPMLLGTGGVSKV